MKFKYLSRPMDSARMGKSQVVELNLEIKKIAIANDIVNNI